jgi:hypothetical protein
MDILFASHSLAVISLPGCHLTPWLSSHSLACPVCGSHRQLEARHIGALIQSLASLGFSDTSSTTAVIMTGCTGPHSHEALPTDEGMTSSFYETLGAGLRRPKRCPASHNEADKARGAPVATPDPRHKKAVTCWRTPQQAVTALSQQPLQAEASETPGSCSSACEDLNLQVQYKAQRH